MAVLHAIRDFRRNARLTQPLFRMPKHVREAFQIYRIYEDGIFQLEDRKGKEKDLYDRAYLFSDINYINKNDAEKRGSPDGADAVFECHEFRFQNHCHERIP